MKNNQAQLKRLMALFVLFLALLAVGFIHGVMGDFGRGFVAGMEAGDSLRKEWTKNGRDYTYLIPDVRIDEAFRPVAQDSTAGGKGREVMIQSDVVTLKVRNSAENLSPMSLPMRLVGDNPMVFYSALIITLSRAAIIILMIVIILSLKRSIREERPMERANILYMRLIGGLLILSELMDAAGTWMIRSHAAEVLADYHVRVDDAFSISYWNLMMAVMVLFAAEVFDIGQRLSEDQQLTI